MAFESVISELKKGNSYLVNLTFPTKISSNFNLRQLFHYSVAPYKLLYKDLFLVFSPECFVRILKGRIYTYPMKGTIDADIENAESILLSDKKETAEHTTVVDLLRNDLSMVAKNVRVEKFQYLQKIITSSKSLLQMSSEISGELPCNFRKSLGEIIFSMLPAGSICGAPKAKTLEIIKNVESYDRNYYTGIFGFFDGENLDSAVMIRYIENTSEGLVYKSGGGITALSDPVKEYQELIDKIYVPVD
jgi:para-aminobenzoate synthetase component 1